MIVPTANNNIIQLDIHYWAAKSSEIVEFDIVQYLENGFLLRESNFRAILETINWEQYKDKHVNIICSNSAIIPIWAYMLIAEKLEEKNAKAYYQCNNIYEAILKYNFIHSDFTGIEKKRVMLKGCNQKNIGPDVYIYITQHLKKIVKSLAYGESCSSVPIFKN